MKILHLISGGDVGGAKTHVLSLLEGLQKTEDVKLVCFTEGEFAEDARKMGIDTLVMDCGVRTALHRLADMVRQDGYEIVHCHGARANMIGAILRLTIHVPIVTTVHSDYRLDYMGRPLDRLTYGTINTVCLRMFDYHIGVSDSMAQLLISRGFDPQTMFSIYNGVDFSGHEPIKSREDYLRGVGLDVQPGQVVFGIAARLNPVKDVGTLIRAFAIAVKTCPEIRLVIAGDGEERQMLTNLAAGLCPAGTVIFAGWESDMDSFYGALDVNTLTSLSETFPYALTEGARQHCATIASDVGGIPYIIENGVTGLLFPPKDAEALAAHMVHLAQNEAFRLQMANNLYEKASAQFSVDATVGRQREIYETILRKKIAPKPKRSGVLICGAYGKGNAGDEAILSAIVAQMKHIDPDIPIYVLSHDPMETKLRYHVGAAHAFNPFTFLPLMHRTKLYLSGGGSLIQDETSSRSLYYYLLSIWLAKHSGNRVLMYGCGIGPVSGKGNRRFAARIMNRCVDAITLRENLSAEELVRLGVTKPKITVTADPALTLEPGSEGAADSFLLGQNLDPAAKYALFVLRPWKGFAEKKQAFVDAANHISQTHGLIPLFFALEPGRDLAPCREVAEALSCKGYVLQTPSDVRLIIGMMKKMQLVVSMRLHTLIFASCVGAPLVAVSYDPKVTGFMQYLGQKHCADFDSLTAETLCRLIDAALNEPEDYSVEHLRELAARNEAAARELLLT